MRSCADFIEITGKGNNKKYLVNKAAITYVSQDPTDETAVILLRDGEHTSKVFTKESYKDVTEEILWFSAIHQSLRSMEE